MTPPAWRRYLRFWGPAPEADVDDELQFHIESRVREYVATGMTETEARRKTLERFGSVDRARRECLTIDRQQERSMSRTAFVDTLRQDVVFALRTLMRRPGWTAITVVTLALGIGANTAIFTLVSNYLFRPLPVRDADRLVVIGTVQSGTGLAGSTSYRNHLDMRGLRDVFSDVTAFAAEVVSVRVGTQEAERRVLEDVADNYFTMLGVQAEVGRVLTAEDVLTREPVVVLSYLYWQRRFGGDPAVVGQRISLNGLPFTIVGVASRRFPGTESALALDGYIPATLQPRIQGQPTNDVLERRDERAYRVMARLAPGVSVDQARAALATLARRLEAEYPDQSRNISFAVASERRARPDIAVAHVLPRVASVFMALVALVLLIACANVAGLLLARGTVRRQEMSVRAALGATRGRVVRQLLTETLVLALTGAVVGIGVGHLITSALGRVKFGIAIPIRLQVEPDWRVYLFTVVAALIAALVAGLAPAFQGSQVDIASALREGKRSAGGGARQRLRRGLVVAQVAVSLVVLVCAGLLVRSARRASQVDLGFKPDNVLIGSFDVALRRYDEAQAKRFYDELLRRARSIPGVRSAAMATHVPLGYSHSSVEVFIDEPRPEVPRGHIAVLHNVVSPDYFPTMGIRVLAGRDFTADDDSTAPRVAIVNDAMATRLWPGRPAVGQRVRLDATGPSVEVIGVVPTGKYVFVSDGARPFVYLPTAQNRRPAQTIHLRLQGSVDAAASALRSIVGDLDPELPMYDVRSMTEHLRLGLAFIFLHIGAALALAFGALGLVEAVAGLYGVVSYSVAQRTREIGIRVALGARPSNVLGEVLRQGLTLTVSGLAMGALLTFLVTRPLGNLLVGVGRTDAVSYTAAAIVLCVCAAIASLVPAWRAARMSPVSALRATE